MKTRQSAKLVIDKYSSGIKPDLVVILGSGLGSAIDCCKHKAVIPYADIPDLPEPSVSGHAGELIIGEISGWNVWFFSGRFHLYEGYSAREVVAPVELAAYCGASRILLTNAAGVINSDFPVHSFMCIADQINLTGDNPLIGIPGNPFVDLSDLYKTALYSSLFGNCGEFELVLNLGVLASVPALVLQEQPECQGRPANGGRHRRLHAGALVRGEDPHRLQQGRLPQQSLAAAAGLAGRHDRDGFKVDLRGPGADR